MCPECTELLAAWVYGSLTTAERMDIWRHARECPEVVAACDAGRMQIAEMRAIPVEIAEAVDAFANA